MYAQLLAYDKGSKMVRDMVESDSVKLLITSLGVNDEESYKESDFTIDFLEEDGNHLGSKKIYFDVPTRCRNARPTIAVDDTPYDLEKYIKEVFKGEREPETDKPDSIVPSADLAKNIDIEEKPTENIDGNTYLGNLKKDAEKWVAPIISIKGRNIPGPVHDAVPGETLEETKRRQERNKRKARKRALRRNKKAA